MLSVLLVFTILLSLLFIVPKTKEFAKKKFEALKEQMMYNGIIRSMQISYMKQCIVVGLVVQNLMEDADEVSTV